MVESQNTTVDIVLPGISYLGVNSYGKIMVGNKAFEFYNDRKVDDYIQIPWDEVDYIAGAVIGKKIARFAIFTKNNGNYSFSSRDNKLLLRHVNKYIPSDRLVRSDSFLKVIKRGIVGLVKRSK